MSDLNLPWLLQNVEAWPPSRSRDIALQVISYAKETESNLAEAQAEVERLKRIALNFQAMSDEADLQLRKRSEAESEVQEVREVLTAVEAVCDEVEHGAYEARGSRAYVTERIRAALSGAPKTEAKS
jgi:hypothetical protein